MHKLLIVEDEYMIQAGLKKIIPWAELGVEIVGALDNGLRALQYVRSHEVDIVLLDINMPVMSGLEFVQRAKKEEIDFHFIVLSGYQEFEYAKECIKYGGENYLLKPVDKKELLDTVGAVVKKLDEMQKENTTAQEGYYCGHVYECIKIIEADFNLDLSLNSVSERLHLNVAYLGQKFKKETNQSFAQYLNEFRMNKAKELLKTTRLNINEVAQSVGYSNEGYFYKKFKEVFGLSPKELRNKG